jgi:hypothetical protein
MTSPAKPPLSLFGSEVTHWHPPGRIRIYGLYNPKGRLVVTIRASDSPSALRIAKAHGLARTDGYTARLFTTAD